MSGLFPEATWIALLEREGFSVDVVDETGVEDERTPRRVFLARKQQAARGVYSSPTRMRNVNCD